MTDILNHEVYNKEMRKSIYDKMFFIDKIDADIFFDFGCADGALINALDAFHDGGLYVGYDEDALVALDTKEKFIKNNKHNVFISSRINDCSSDFYLKKTFNKEKKTCLILSSVLHEIYSYKNTDYFEWFWEWVENRKFDYIVIRDMTSAYIHYEKEQEIYKKIMKKCEENEHLKKKLIDFQSIWSDLYFDLDNMYHFLLKYRYDDNWDREVKEDYFAFSINEMQKMKKRLSYYYDNKYFEYFSVPFIREQVKKDFDIDFDVNTHFKCIYKRK